MKRDVLGSMFSIITSGTGPHLLTDMYGIFSISIIKTSKFCIAQSGEEAVLIPFYPFNVLRQVFLGKFLARAP
jgi:ATP/ADP translocase